MNKKHSITIVDVEKKPVNSKTEKPRWKQPELVLLGRLEDLVQGVGTGKTGPSRDGDPFVAHFPPGY